MADASAVPGAVALCADDYAITEGVSRAMLDLVDARRLSAVSAMTSMPGWPELARDIASRRGSVAIGLHLDLTLRPYDGRAPALPLRDLVFKALFGWLDVAGLTAEFERQFDAFETAAGVAPDHVDAHHHVHVLPQARFALLAVLRRRYRTSAVGDRPLVRDPGDAFGRIATRRGQTKKALATAVLGAGFRGLLARSGFHSNSGFSGFSAFRRDIPFERELDVFLAAPGQRHLVMCHPGFADAALAALDPVGPRRGDEFRALMEREDLADWMLRVDRSADDPCIAFAEWLSR